MMSQDKTMRKDLRKMILYVKITGQQCCDGCLLGKYQINRQLKILQEQGGWQCFEDFLVWVGTMMEAPVVGLVNKRCVLPSGNSWNLVDARDMKGRLRRHLKGEFLTTWTKQ